MKNKKNALLIIFLAISYYSFCQQDADSSTKRIQDLKMNFDKLYGLNPELLNGKKLIYPYNDVEGHPYLYNQETHGSVTIKGEEYKDLLLRFNILDNELILMHTDKNSASVGIVLINKWIDNFHIKEITYKKMLLKETGEKFLQVIYEDELSCYLYWSKEIILSSNINSEGHYFSDAKWKGFLILEQTQYTFHTKHSFLIFFDKKERKTLRMFIRENKIKFRRIKPGELKRLIQFCNENNLYEK